MVNFPYSGPMPNSRIAGEKFWSNMNCGRMKFRDIKNEKRMLIKARFYIYYYLLLYHHFLVVRPDVLHGIKLTIGKQYLKKRQTKLNYMDKWCDNDFSKLVKDVNFFPAASQIIMKIIILLTLNVKSLGWQLKYS